MTRPRLAVLLVLLSLVVGQTHPAWAGTFNVNRVQVFLSARARSEILTVQNSSAEPLRFQLGAFAWDQSPQGEMILGPTRDIVFFPQLFTLAPGDKRNIRVGATVPPGLAEKTYRLFIEELPPVEGSGPSPAPGQVRVLTRLGIPIFLQPGRAVAQGGIEAMELRQGRLSFRLRNTGTAHFVAQAITITGLGAAGETVLQGVLEGWYVLAGGVRLYEFEVPPDRCPQVKAVSLEVRTSQGVLAGRLDAPIDGCGQ